MRCKRELKRKKTRMGIVLFSFLAYMTVPAFVYVRPRSKYVNFLQVAFVFELYLLRNVTMFQPTA